MAPMYMPPVTLRLVTLWISFAGVIISVPPMFKRLAFAVAPETIVVALTIVDAKMEPVALILPTL